VYQFDRIGFRARAFDVNDLLVCYKFNNRYGTGIPAMWALEDSGAIFFDKCLEWFQVFFLAELMAQYNLPLF